MKEPKKSKIIVIIIKIAINLIFLALCWNCQHRKGEREKRYCYLTERMVGVLFLDLCFISLHRKVTIWFKKKKKKLNILQSCFMMTMYYTQNTSCLPEWLSCDQRSKKKQGERDKVFGGGFDYCCLRYSWIFLFVTSLWINVHIWHVNFIWMNRKNFFTVLNWRWCDAPVSSTVWFTLIRRFIFILKYCLEQPHKQCDIKIKSSI